MARRALRIAASSQLSHSARVAGFDVYDLPPLPSYDFHRTLDERLRDGVVFRDFFEKHDIELLLDHNTEALTLLPSDGPAGSVALTSAAIGFPYVSCYLDPVTSTMSRVDWAHHWQLLESKQWIKWIWESAHAQELQKLGVPNILTLPMAAADDDFDVSPLPETQQGPVAAFMGHPGTSWFSSGQQVPVDSLYAGFTAAAVHADMPDLPFHKIYFDLYRFADPTSPEDAPALRFAKSQEYFARKFTYNAFLAVKQRDRFARFLKVRLGDAFELVGDHWGQLMGLSHTPRIWDKKLLHQKMRKVPICLNLMKGCLESGLNIRHFEITAYGGFMLTYPTSELSTCFTIGEECDIFHQEEELLVKISYYLENDRRRRDIAAAGQRRTLAEHLYSHRILQLVDILKSAGAVPAGCSRSEAANEAPLQAAAPSNHSLAFS